MTMTFPNGKRFAFTIIDDTDVARVENVAPMYRLLEDLGFRTTKTVWPVKCPEGSPDFCTSQTLEDADYLAFVLDLQRRGFEVTWHGATMESSRRDRTVYALERFRDVFGHFPRVHVNHAYNRENLYWGADRVDVPLLKLLGAKILWRRQGAYLGHVEGSAYWWGDFCEHVRYGRNLTFGDVNLAGINPSMPYHDPARPLVPMWFSASDAEGGPEFIELMRPEQQQRLEDEEGFCILATHLGKGYVQDGRVHPLVRERLESLARRPGWFPTVSELLDWLRERRKSRELPEREWRRMQWRWARDLVMRKLKPTRPEIARRIVALEDSNHDAT
jgi:hypothetical protein